MILEHLTEFPLTEEEGELVRPGRLSDYAGLLGPARNAVRELAKLSHAGSMSPEIRELVKIRSSQLNGCAHCLSMHFRDAVKHGMRPDKLATIDAWWECDWFTPQERAALAWTEAVTLVSNHEISDELYNECRKVFSEQEMVDLTIGIVEINCWNRFAISFASPPDAWSLEDTK